MNNEGPKFEIVTQELLGKLHSKYYYCGGRELKEGNLIMYGYTIGYANINGHPPSSYYSHDDACSLILNMFVWDKEQNLLFQSYTTSKNNRKP